MKKILLMLLLLIIAFRFCCGIFIIQPIGAIPDGRTIIYLRIGLNLPFVSSADSLLEDSGSGVSLLGRGLTLANIAEPIMERKLIVMDYYESLYLWSTGGKVYKN